MTRHTPERLMPPFLAHDFHKYLFLFLFWSLVFALAFFESRQRVGVGGLVPRFLLDRWLSATLLAM